MSLFTGSLTNLYQIFKSNKEDHKEENKNMDNEHSYLSRVIAKFLFLFSNLLQSSTGRDKFCSLIQYIAKLYSACILYTIDIENKVDTDSLYSKYDSSKRVEKSMSSGRKIFRLLKFLEDLKKLFIYFYKTPDAVKILKGMILLSGFFYHIMDNLVWGVNVGILNEFLVGDIRYKMSKNFFSLIRNWIKLIMDCIKIKKYVSYDKFNEEEIISQFNKEMSSFKINSNYNTIKQTLENRAKIRMKTLDIIHSSLRICMISYNLKLEPLYSISHPVYIALFGLSQVSISIFKHLVKISEYSNTYSIYGHFEINKSSSLEKLLIDTNLNEDQIFRPDYFDHYYIDFNKDYSEKSEKIIKYIPKRLNFEEE